MAPSNAMVKAGPISPIMCVSDKSGRLRAGSPRGMPPKAVPNVATPGKRQIA